MLQLTTQASILYHQYHTLGRSVNYVILLIKLNMQLYELNTNAPTVHFPRPFTFAV